MGRKEPKANAVAAELDKLRGKQTDGKVNLADASFIKRALDEGASKACSSVMPSSLPDRAENTGNAVHISNPSDLSRSWRSKDIKRMSG